MFLRSTNQMGRLFLMSVLAVQFTACNEAEFFQKEFLEDGSVGTTIVNNCTGNCATNNGNGGSLTPGGTETGGGTTTNPGDGGTTTNPGGGTTTPTVTYKDMTDNFSQNASESRPLDILWVMDNSGSMGDEQDSLAYNFDIFIQDFVTRNVDFQMAITTTDARSGYEGAAVGSFNMLNNTAAQNDQQGFIDYFAQKIAVGTGGSGTEKGLNGMRKFIENDGASWLRKDAFLVVVVISDEEDQSSGTVSSYVDHLKSLKDSDRLININSIVTMTSDGYGGQTRGDRYMEASNATGGVVADIENNFYDILKNMGGTILNLISSFPLSGDAVASSIEVYVNNVKQTTGWTYDSTNNAIKFQNGYTPSESAAIQVKYKVEVK